MHGRLFVYILASGRNGTLYIGVTTNLAKRMHQHKNEFVDGFTKKYNVKNLVYFESYPELQAARQRERSMKKWNRAWKMELIEGANPRWDDLYESLLK